MMRVVSAGSLTLASLLTAYTLNVFAPSAAADSRKITNIPQIAQKDEDHSVEDRPKLDPRLNAKSYTTLPTTETKFSIKVTYVQITNTLKVRLLTPLDLPAPYGKDSSSLPASEFLTATKAQLVTVAGSSENSARTKKPIPQGFVKSQFYVRALPRKARVGTQMQSSHFMDAVVCVQRNGQVVSRETLKWEELKRWLSETDQFPDCAEAGPIFVERGSETGFEKDMFGVVTSENYMKNRVRMALWQSDNYGIIDPIFYCQLSNGMAVFGIAEQIEPTTGHPMALGDLAKAISGKGQQSNWLSCERAILLGHRDAGYFGGVDPIANDQGQSKTLFPMVFAIAVK